MEILVDEKKMLKSSVSTSNSSPKTSNSLRKMNSCAWKDVQIAEKRQAIGPTTTIDFTSNEWPRYLETWTRTSQRKKFKSKKAKASGHAFSVDNRGWILPVPFLFYHRRFPMKALEDYIAFWSRILTNTKGLSDHPGICRTFTNGKEVDHYDSYVYTDKP